MRLLVLVILSIVVVPSMAHRREGGERPGRRVFQRQVDRLKSRIRPMIQGRDTAHMLRATFHDSVGGSDGCLNRNVDSNSGFDNDEDNFIRIVDTMDEFYDNEADCSGLSRADFYVLAGEVAVENALVNAKVADGVCTGFDDCGDELDKLCFSFQYGREDCPTSPFTDVLRPFPDGHLNSSGVFDFFRNMYGMSIEESVAILGGHTLGRATGFLGWEGIWVEDEEEEIQFDNFFYQNLLDEEVVFGEQVQLPDHNGEPRFQWNGIEIEDGEEEIYLMLNADMALFKNITTDETGRSSCSFDTCEDSLGAPYVRNFAGDNDLFLKRFSQAWNKMVTAGTKGRLRRPSRGWYWGAN